VAATAANTAAATSGSTASAFGLFGEPKKAALATTAPPAQSNPLSLGQNTTNTAASVSGVSTPTAAPSLFGQPKKPEVSATSQATGQPAATSTVDNASKSTSLGASMTGPRPHPQSTLKNKSMDEIINRWANDLAKYQKEFQKQAMKISEWDHCRWSIGIWSCTEAIIWRTV
jgi:nuclear pore complex protein Nup62